MVFRGGTEFVCRKSLPALEDLPGVWESADLDEARFRGCRRHHTTAGRRLGTPKKRKRYKILILLTVGVTCSFLDLFFDDNLVEWMWPTKLFDLKLLNPRD